MPDFPGWEFGNEFHHELRKSTVLTPRATYNASRGAPGYWAKIVHHTCAWYKSNQKISDKIKSNIKSNFFGGPNYHIKFSSDLIKICCILRKFAKIRRNQRHASKNYSVPEKHAASTLQIVSYGKSTRNAVSISHLKCDLESVSLKCYLEVVLNVV